MMKTDAHTLSHHKKNDLQRDYCILRESNVLYARWGGRGREKEKHMDPLWIFQMEDPLAWQCRNMHNTHTHAHTRSISKPIFESHFCHKIFMIAHTYVLCQIWQKCGPCVCVCVFAAVVQLLDGWGVTWALFSHDRGAANEQGPPCLRLTRFVTLTHAVKEANGDLTSLLLKKLLCGFIFNCSVVWTPASLQHIVLWTIYIFFSAIHVEKNPV